MNIIFHYPLPLNSEATSASGIRPLEMLEAFKSLGCDVDVVLGYSGERKESIRRIKRNIEAGVKYSFVYSESSTMPTILTDPHHLPLAPFFDFGFFRFCKKNGIPVGLFYRDIYWVFSSYGEHLSSIKKLGAKVSYFYDLLNYRQCLSKLYLPSLEMGAYIPLVSPTLFSALPPGHSTGERPVSSTKHSCVGEPLQVFYVGGVSKHYQMHKLFAAVAKRTDVQLTVCTRAAEWEVAKSEYPLGPNIHVVHESGANMRNLMAAADVVSLFVQPQRYREFAVPVKLYEYLGQRKPIIASQGTLAGQFIKEEGIGWTLPYCEGSLDALFDTLVAQRDFLSKVSDRMDSVAQSHTWIARAEQVIKDLTV